MHAHMAPQAILVHTEFIGNFVRLQPDCKIDQLLDVAFGEPKRPRPSDRPSAIGRGDSAPRAAVVAAGVRAGQAEGDRAGRRSAGLNFGLDIFGRGRYRGDYSPTSK